MKLIDIHQNMTNYYVKMRLVNCTYSLVNYIVARTRSIIFNKTSIEIIFYLRSEYGFN